MNKQDVMDQRELILRFIFGRTCDMIQKECKEAGISLWQVTEIKDLTGDSVKDYLEQCRQTDHPLYKEFHAQLEREIEYDTMHHPGAVQSEDGQWWTHKWW